jgi:hypothetical protein
VASFGQPALIILAGPTGPLLAPMRRGATAVVVGLGGGRLIARRPRSGHPAIWTGLLATGSAAIGSPLWTSPVAGARLGVPVSVVDLGTAGRRPAGREGSAVNVAALGSLGVCAAGAAPGSRPAPGGPAGTGAR